jgi:hypothetical protein
MSLRELYQHLIKLGQVNLIPYKPLWPPYLYFTGINPKRKNIKICNMFKKQIGMLAYIFNLDIF